MIAVRTQPAYPSRYELLDGLRGVAALLVVCTHLGVVAGQVGHLAVMVFFVISGYCIAASAEISYRDQTGFGHFMLRRITRIYPPYLCAVALYVGTRILKSSMGGADDLHRPLIVWLQNLTITQWVTDLFHPVADAVQNHSLFVAAFWSLNYEEQFYIVMALGVLLMIHRGIPLLHTILGLAVIGVAWNWIVPDDRVYGLFIEYWAHFAMGASLFYVLTNPTPVRTRVFLIVVTLLGLTSVAGVIAHGIERTIQTPHAALAELSFLSAVILTLYFLRPVSGRIARSILWRPLASLGVISYSLYLIHQFNLHLVASMAQRILSRLPLPSLLIPLEIALHVLLATIFWWFFERPFTHRNSRSKLLAANPIPLTVGTLAP